MLENTALTKLIANSPLLRTFIFMCCSVLILNAKRRKAYKGFWLMEPTPYNATTVKQTGENDDNGSCNHKNKSCKQYALQGIRNFMLTGLGLDTIKMLMSNVPPNVNGFMAKFYVKLKAFKLRSFALLTSYVAIYRVGVRHFLLFIIFISFGFLKFSAAALLLQSQFRWRLTAETQRGGFSKWIWLHIFPKINTALLWDGRGLTN